MGARGMVVLSDPGVSHGRPTEQTQMPQSRAVTAQQRLVILTTLASESPEADLQVIFSKKEEDREESSS